MSLHTCWKYSSLNLFVCHCREMKSNKTHTSYSIMGDQQSQLHENFWLHGKLKNDCIRIKINMFEEMRFFLIFYLNLGFKVCWALVLLILSKFSFLSIGYSFSRTFILLFWLECMSTLFEVHTNFICNPTQINDREWLYIKFRKTCHAIFEKKLHKRSDIVKVLHGWLVTTTLPNKYQANDLIPLIAGPWKWKSEFSHLAWFCC